MSCLGIPCGGAVLADQSQQSNWAEVVIHPSTCMVAAVVRALVYTALFADKGGNVESEFGGTKQAHPTRGYAANHAPLRMSEYLLQSSHKRLWAAVLWVHHRYSWQWSYRQ